MEGRRRRGLVVHYCNECNYGTQSKSDLVKHSRTHTFHCKLCDQKFGKKCIYSLINMEGLSVKR